MPGLHKLDPDTMLARRPIGEITFIRRLAHTSGLDIAALWPLNTVVVDGQLLHRSSLAGQRDASFAMEYELRARSHHWKLMIQAPPAPNNSPRWTVYSATWEGRSAQPAKQ